MPGELQESFSLLLDMVLEERGPIHRFVQVDAPVVRKMYGPPDPQAAIIGEEPAALMYPASE
jgi:hypothetical protein